MTQEEKVMTPITTIVHFEIPDDNIDEFLSLWKEKVRWEMVKQPGIIGGVFHRGIDPYAPFQFINVARWQSAESLESGLQATGEALQQKYGIEIAGTFKNLGVKVTQNNYIEEVDYTGDIRH